jgi:hypothetical protein
MKTRGFVSVLCVVCLVGLSVPSGTAECALNAGIQQAQEGEYAAAITTLRCVVDRLVPNPQAKTDLKTAYIYLGVSYLGLDQEADARRVLILALKLDPELQLKTTDFPPRVVRFFDKVHQEAIASGTVPRPRGPAGKKSSKAPLFIIGGAAVAGVGAALALGGGAKPTPTPTPPPPVPCATVDVATGNDPGIAAVTEFAFSCNGASAPGGGVLSYRWQFTDGATATGQSAQHRFGVGGTYTAAVFVSAGGVEVQGPSATVTVRSMSGVWSNQQNENGAITTRNFTITQGSNSPTIAGTYYNSSCPGDGVIEGSVSAPRHVRIQATNCLGPTVFEGDTDPAVSKMILLANGTTLTFTRQ